MFYEERYQRNDARGFLRNSLSPRTFLSTQIAQSSETTYTHTYGYTYIYFNLFLVLCMYLCWYNAAGPVRDRDQENPLGSAIISRYGATTRMKNEKKKRKKNEINIVIQLKRHRLGLRDLKLFL